MRRDDHRHEDDEQQNSTRFHLTAAYGLLGGSGVESENPTS
jgi:hypothetical protein